MDVTLIIIFFFVILSHLENTENAGKTQQKIQEMEEAIDKAEKKEALTDQKYKEYLEARDIVKTTNERHGEYISEILDFLYGRNLKIFLYNSNGRWMIKMMQEDSVLLDCSLQDSTDIEIITELDTEGYTPDNDWNDYL